jgi:dolichol kinase
VYVWVYKYIYIYETAREREREKPGGFLAHIVPLKPFCSFSFPSFFLSQLSSTSLLLQLEGREKKKEGGRSSNPITIAPLFLSLAFLFPKSKKIPHIKRFFSRCVWVAEQYQSGISPAVDLL